MAIVEIESVRSKFEPGDSPKGSDYLDLIDSLAALPDISGKQDVVANVSSTEIGYLDGVTSAIQTQINTKAPTASPTFTGTVTIPSGSAITGVPYLATANTFTGGVQQITTASAATVGLIVKASASQTANLQEWQNSSGTVLGSISSTGKITSAVDASINGVAFGLGNSGSASRNIAIGAFAGASLGDNDSNIFIGYAAGQYAYGASNTIVGTQAGTVSGGGGGNYNTYLGFQSGYSGTGSSNVMIGYQSGNNTSGDNKLVISNSNTATPLIGGDFSAKTLIIAGNATATSQAAATVGLIVKGAASQTANLQEWQNSAGTAYLSIGAPFSNAAGINIPIQFSSGGNGQIKWGNNTVWGIGTITGQTNVMYPYAANRTALIIQGLASQTANLQEWQNSAGTVLTYVRNDGLIHTSAGILTTGSFIGSNGYIADTQLSSTARAATVIGAVIRGAASQTANLQEWQNSAGTVIAKVNSSGNIVAGNMAIATSSVSTIHISNGTIPSADPTGGGVLYVEAGALKFRGSSGTVTTIAVA